MCARARESLRVEVGRGRLARLKSSVWADSSAHLGRDPARAPSLSSTAHPGRDPAVCQRPRVCHLMTHRPDRQACGPCQSFGESHLHLHLVCVCQSRSLSLARSLSLFLQLRLHLHIQRQRLVHPQAGCGQTLALCRALRGGFCCWSRAAPPSGGRGYLVSVRACTPPAMSLGRGRKGRHAQIHTDTDTDGYRDTLA